MSMSGTFNVDPVEVMPWSASDGPVVFHYSTSSHSRFTRPMSDWVALISSGFITTGVLYILVFAMAMHPIT